LRLSPNISANSGPPFNITSGVDEFGDFQFNTRPALLPSGSSAPSGCVSSSAGSPLTSAGALANTGACVVFLTKYGNFVVNPPAQSNLKPIPADFGSGFAQINVNMRISRTWGFGESVTANPNQRRGGGGPPGGGRGPGAGGGGRPGGGAPPGGGGGFFGGGDASGKKYTVTLGLYVRNIFNTVNQGLPEGDLVSPRFGETLTLATFGQGATQSANRRMEFNLRFGF
jgi:hypothetical protein